MLKESKTLNKKYLELQQQLEKQFEQEANELVKDKTYIVKAKSFTGWDGKSLKGTKVYLKCCGHSHTEFEPFYFAYNCENNEMVGDKVTKINEIKRRFQEV